MRTTSGEGKWQVPCEDGKTHTLEVRHLAGNDARHVGTYVWHADCPACRFVPPPPAPPGTLYEITTQPCGACGSFSQIVRVAPETDWRPLPSCAEVLAHNARTGGDCYGPWLCVEDPDDEHCMARVVPLAVGLAYGGDHDEVCSEPDITPRLANPAARYRPITRRGEALPWPGATQ